MNRILSFMAGFIILWITGYILVAGRGLLIPLVISIFVWHLLNTIKDSMQLIPVLGERLPSWFRMILSLLLVALLIKIIVDITSNNVNEVISASARYQENLQHLLMGLEQRFHIKDYTHFDDVMKSLNIKDVVLNIYGVFTAVMSSAVLIALYVVFLFVEQHYFTQKMDALFPNTVNRKLINNIISHVTKDTQTYLGIKTLLSVGTAFFSWIIMKAVGLDFAEFWALFIFFLNYIPNIGAIIATAFPVALAMVQFQSWVPFLEVTLGIIGVQFLSGNVLEPKLLGKSLNLSPLVILIALSVWGAIWGILGMFLSVPITVLLLIIFAHFEATRPIAVLLSQDGYVTKAYENIE